MAQAEPDPSVVSTLDIADTGVGDGNTGEGTFRRGGKTERGGATNLTLPSRPSIQRNHSQPPPQQPPPPPASEQDQPGSATDSLSLMQLRRLVTEMPRFEPLAYAFVYDDAASFQEELNEWFSYSEEDQSTLLRAKTAFETQWAAFVTRKLSVALKDAGWINVNNSMQQQFVVQKVAGLTSPDNEERHTSLQSLLYIGLGVWGETAHQERSTGYPAALSVDANGHGGNRPNTENLSMQLQWILNGTVIIESCGGLQAVYDMLRKTLFREWDDVQDPSQQLNADMAMVGLEAEIVYNSLTLMYLFVEAGRLQVRMGHDASLRNALVCREPDYLMSLVKLLARLRWDDATALPLTKILLLLWKSILLIFGGSPELNETKMATREELSRTTDDDLKTVITASPLDYHLFRQEITSKYPAYDPPPPLFPLDGDNNSILPPLPNHPSKTGNNAPRSGVGPANINSSSSSILHQPVHIATPAPSPPPSPVGPGGKAGKKQNYQTNQNFPFLYPPLDVSGNLAENGINNRLQGTLDVRKWDRTDVPASILEAGELFAGRMRMSRALRQLWEERERYLKFERGWAGVDADKDISNDSAKADGRDGGPSPNPEVIRRLDLVETFYKNALPHLQSLVIVLLKVVLANVTALFAQPSQVLCQNGLAPPFQSQDQTNGNDQVSGKNKENNGRMANGYGENEQNEVRENSIVTIEEVDAARSREITAKAVSGLLLLLLKWFKISHVLKFEFLTQLLLDSNYLPLILKLYAHQDLDKAIDSIIDREELNFFTFCRNHSNQVSPAGKDDPDDLEDACPSPKVKRYREHADPAPGQLNGAADASVGEQRTPQTDELGCPIPSEPITTFSWRNFFSNINFLRIMQKICKHKVHRNLLLVQYKSSTILKKALKVPQSDLRLYTLKLFKNQVPYCGRKWRQTNMRVITAVYLHCRPELRDDWLAGSDVDSEVEEALPLEQALRALTHWHNLKRYPDQMGAEPGVLDDEQDFFVRELERMEFGDMGFTAEELQRENGWDGPLQLEGW